MLNLFLSEMKIHILIQLHKETKAHAAIFQNKKKTLSWTHDNDFYNPVGTLLLLFFFR